MLAEIGQERCISQTCLISILNMAMWSGLTKRQLNWKLAGDEYKLYINVMLQTKEYEI